MPNVSIALAAQIVALAGQVAAVPAPAPTPTPTPIPTPTPVPTPIPTPTPIPGLLNDIGPGQSFTAADGAVWSIVVDGQYNLVMRNGARAAGLLATRVVEQADHAIKALRSGTNTWQLWSGTGWNQTTAPS